jgi:hypothetical protein
VLNIFTLSVLGKIVFVDLTYWEYLEDPYISGLQPILISLGLLWYIFCPLEGYSN